MSYQQDPAELLIYYLDLAGAPTHGDCAVEIREIVEGIKAGAVEQAKKEILAELAVRLSEGAAT